MAALGLGFLAMAVLARQLFTSSTLLYDDLWWLYWPLRSHVNQELLAGRLPLWDAFRFCGMPLIGNVESAVFYPPNWASLVIPLERFFAWFAAFHLALGALGAWWLSRQLGTSPAGAMGAGMAYGLGGTMVTSVFSAVHLPAQAWMPWLLGAGVAGRPVLGGVFLALMLLAGSPQFAAYAILALATWMLVHRRWLQLVTIGALGGLLAAVQLLPLLELVPYSTRASLTQGNLAEEYVLQPGWEWLLPERAGLSPQGFYFPTLLWLLALAGWRSSSRGARVFAAVGLVAVLGAAQVPGVREVLGLVPGMALFRAPIRLLCLTALGLSLLAGYGVQRLGRPALVLSLLAADLLWLGWPRIPATPLAVARTEPADFSRLAASCPDQRLMFGPYVDMRYYNWGLAVSKPSASGYGGVALGDYVRFLGYGWRGRPLTLKEQMLVTRMSNMMPFTRLHPHFSAVLNLGMGVTSPQPEASPSGERYPPGAGGAWLAGLWERLPDQDAIWERLKTVDPARVALVDAELPWRSRETSGQVQPTGWEPGRRQWEVHADGPALLIVSEVFYPGWVARVDGSVVPLVRVDGLLQGVGLSGGTHRVELRYEPLSVRLGALLSLLGLGLVYFFSRRK